MRLHGPLTAVRCCFQESYPVPSGDGETRQAKDDGLHAFDADADGVTPTAAVADASEASTAVLRRKPQIMHHSRSLLRIHSGGSRRGNDPDDFHFELIGGREQVRIQFRTARLPSPHTHLVHVLTAILDAITRPVFTY